LGSGRAAEVTNLSPFIAVLALAGAGCVAINNPVIQNDTGKPPHSRPSIGVMEPLARLDSEQPAEGGSDESLLGRGSERQLEFPSIGSERKTYFPYHRRFFDPGVCSRLGWAVSS